MLKIFVPNKNIPEKKYIIDVLLSEFLRIPYSIKFHNLHHYIIAFNDRKIVFEDHFWANQSNEEYLKLENLPKDICYLNNEFTSHLNLPILYGSDKLLVEEKNIVSGFDIFASSFFMLARWEEYVNPVRDHFSRFPGIESVAFKNNFIKRPIVNEYAEFIWNLLKRLGYNKARDIREFKVIPTFDVDYLFFYKNFYSTIKNLKSLIRRRKIYEAYKYLGEYYNVKMKNSSDKYDTYKKLMDDSEKIGAVAHFFFLNGSNRIYDRGLPLEDKRFIKVSNRIKERCHEIGYHPGFDTYNNPELWNKAKEKLDNLSGFENKIGRQHYLRFEIPKTWQIWEEHKMEWDSTLGYADLIGFRCGSCYEFSVFDILNRKRLKLKEYPLLIMDVTLKNYLKLSSEDAIKVIGDMKSTVKNFCGNFVFLWHNSSFNIPDWDVYKKVYKEIWN